MKFLYKYSRIILYPIVFLANILQNKFTSFFTPMNMGPVSDDSYSSFIKQNINKNDFVLDFGSGAGFFSKLFSHKKYLGVEINENFVKISKKNYPDYEFKILKNDYLKGYEKKIDIIFINNVLHHLTDNQINNTITYFKKKLKKKTKFLIIEPLFPKTFFSLEFLMKVVDIGDNIKSQKGYLRLLNKILKINKYNVKKVGIGSVLIIKGCIN